MRYFPICLDLKNRPVLVVGGGVIAEGKILQLVEANAKVHIVSPALTPTLHLMVKQGIVTWHEGEFADSDVNDKFLVISATDLQTLNEAVAKAAAQQRIWCNVVDQPALCDFITPSLVTRGDLQISISTAGKSPTVAQRVKREIGELIGTEYEILLEITAELRIEVRKLSNDFNTRRDFLKLFVESNALELIRAGKTAAAQKMAQQMLAEFSQSLADNHKK